MNPIQLIATVGTPGQVLLPNAFLAGTLDKVPDFKIESEIIFFLDHGRQPFFASLLYHLLTTKYTNLTK